MKRNWLFSLAALAIASQSVHAKPALPPWHAEASTRVGDRVNSGNPQNPDLTPAAVADSISIASGLHGLGQPSAYITSASGTAGPAGGPLNGTVPFTVAEAHSENLSYAEGHSYFRYTLNIAGPQTMSVPVDVSYIYRLAGGNFFNGQVLTDGAESFSRIEILLSNANFLGDETFYRAIGCGVNGGGGNNCGGFGSYTSRTEQTSLLTNTNYTVIITSYATAYNRVTSGLGFNFAYASAYIDPSFTVSSSFADASSYTITTSSGILNGSLPAVPEPTSLALTLGGLAWIVSRIRRSGAVAS